MTYIVGPSIAIAGGIGYQWAEIGPLAAVVMVLWGVTLMVLGAVVNDLTNYIVANVSKKEL